VTAGRALWMETMSREEYEWDLLTPLTRETWERRAAGDLSFVPSQSRFEAVGQSLPDEVLDGEQGSPPAPEHPAELIDVKDKRINAGAKTVINRFLKNGWTVEVSYARGPWIMTRSWHVCDSILVRARYGELRAAAQWIRKEWLEKDKAIWSNEIMRVNDNQGYPLKADELKDLTLRAQHARVAGEPTPSNEGEL
jgi:hypothetical protein